MKMGSSLLSTGHNNDNQTSNMTTASYNSHDTSRWIEYWDNMFQNDMEEQLLLTTVPSEEERLIKTSKTSDFEQEDACTQLEADLETLVEALSCCGAFLPVFLWDEEGPVLGAICEER